MVLSHKPIINEHAKFKCRCDCGTVRYVNGSALRSGAAKSCGCVSLEKMLKIRTKHGLTIGKPIPEYATWRSMKGRCHRKTHQDYNNYGARGIKVCKRWKNSFQNFIDDMGRKPSAKHSLDRINVNGNYKPANCRWATPLQQGRNKRSVVLSYELAEKIRKLHRGGMLQKHIADKVGISFGLVSRVVLNQSWTHH